MIVSIRPRCMEVKWCESTTFNLHFYNIPPSFYNIQPPYFSKTSIIIFKEPKYNIIMASLLLQELKPINILQPFPT